MKISDNNDGDEFSAEESEDSTNSSCTSTSSASILCDQATASKAAAQTDQSEANQAIKLRTAVASQHTSSAQFSSYKNFTGRVFTTHLSSRLSFVWCPGKGTPSAPDRGRYGCSMVGAAFTSRTPFVRFSGPVDHSKKRRSPTTSNGLSSAEFQTKTSCYHNQQNLHMAFKSSGPPSTVTRGPFQSPPTFVEFETKEFWTKVTNFQRRRRDPSTGQNLAGQLLAPDDVATWASFFVKIWAENKTESFLAFDCLQRLLEICLNTYKSPNKHFEAFTEALMKKFVPFLVQTMPALIDSDNLHCTDYVDVLMLHMSAFYLETGQNVVADLITALPFFGPFYLKQHEKIFQELFAHIQSSEMKGRSQNSKGTQVTTTPPLHFPPRKLIVSNAPPIQLKRRLLFTRKRFECKAAAGGLVSGIKPSLKQTDVWLSYLDADILDLDKVPDNLVSKLLKQNVLYSRRKFRRSTSAIRLSQKKTTTTTCAETPPSDRDVQNELFLYDKAEQDFLSLQTKLDQFAEKNFVVNPLIILKDEHSAFYNGISNGLLWPALHNLPQYIEENYRGEVGKKKLATDWSHYTRVNHHFAIHAARSCRKQDFLWIHDYQLFLVGAICRSLDPTLDCGFFLHIPFCLTDAFMAKFRVQGLAVLRGLLGFTKVGFQTNRDTKQFVEMVRQYFPGAEATPRCLNSRVVYSVAYKGFVTHAGTFPIGIKTSNILNALASPEAPKFIKENRQKIMQNRSGKLFLSVERFDYTKGILERLRAIQKYFEKYPERAHLDVFYQVASSSRTEVITYKAYQESCSKLCDQVNDLVCRLTGNSQVKAVILDQANHSQEKIFWLYKTADVIVVTPLTDGMNLVIKEAVICNPQAVFLMSTGAGAERQLFDGGLSHCYVRIEDVNNVELFADLLLKAANVGLSDRTNWGRALSEFTRKFDVDHWIASFVDPSWTQQAAV